MRKASKSEAVYQTPVGCLFTDQKEAVNFTKLEESLMWLEKRTADRRSRGVEGKHEK